MSRNPAARTFALLAPLLLLPALASGQSISSGPVAVVQVPVDNPLALGILLLVMAVSGWWLLRRGYGANRVASWLLLAAMAGWAGHGSGLMAQVVRSFTSASGETQPITVSPITAGGFTGFEPADFANASGTALRITAVVPPDFAQCYAANPANTLLPAGAPAPSPHPGCSVGAVLANGTSCRVDVEAICRGLFTPTATLTAVNANTGAASGAVGVTLTGTGLTGATQVTFGGLPATAVNVVNSTTITAVTPGHAAGAVDVVVITPAGAAVLTNGYTYAATMVGMSASGGIIAALNGGLQNLIAAAADNSIAITWGGSGIVTNAQSITDGATNTAVIVNVLGGAPGPAQICADYEVDSQGNSPCQAGNTCYNDWFLPAENQLNALFVNSAAIGGFGSALYWSSTEFSGNPTTSALAQSFVNGNATQLIKNAALRARCVRAFVP